MNKAISTSSPIAALDEKHDEACSSSKEWLEGYAWKNNHLYHFKKNSITVMRMWPEMQAWHKTSTKPWAPTLRYADEAICELSMQPGKLERWHKFVHSSSGSLPDMHDWHYPAALRVSKFAPAFATIPNREREIASQFTEGRWHVLALMARCPGANDLLESNPALGFALANHQMLCIPAVAQPIRSVRALLYKPQQAILEWLGFPATESVRNILMKIEPCALEAKYLPQIRAALHDSKVQDVLLQIPVISVQALWFAAYSQNRELFGYQFIYQVAQETKGMKLHYLGYIKLWQECQKMLAFFKKDLPSEINDVQQLKNIYDALMAEYHGFYKQQVKNYELALKRKKMSAGNALKFPSPPFCEARNIIPLTRTLWLMDEDEKMQNGVFAYYRDILEGRCYVYRVNAPIRATLVVRKNKAGRWGFDKIMGFKGEPINAFLKNQIWRSLVLS